uniref:Uncharacterized protein n=1 Tax=Arundo donax TaxID=35708 RepID=A0A0A9FDR2_ARUDO
MSCFVLERIGLGRYCLFLRCGGAAGRELRAARVAAAG